MKMGYKVMLTTEGTYPFHNGGVSIWCDHILHHLKDEFDFSVYSIMMNPFITQKFTLPKESALIKVPLWGTEEPSEYINIPFSKAYLIKKNTTRVDIREKFLPLFQALVEEVFFPVKDPARFGQTLKDLYLYFQDHDYKISFKSEMVWNTYQKLVARFTEGTDKSLPAPGAFSIINSLSWLYRFMTVLCTPLPRMDVTHSSAAAFSSIPCVLEKLLYGVPFLLTEHGIYLREQYLSLYQRGYPPFLATLFIRLVQSVVSLSYHFADQVSPVCNYNTRWERRFGVKPQHIQVIYNGVDGTLFSGMRAGQSSGHSPGHTVVSVARIDPVKDIETLLRAAALVIRQIPDARFLVYGSVTVPEYYRKCLQLKESLGLGDRFVFAGHSDDMAAVYRQADMVAISSISEAFPYAAIEAMIAGKAVAATDVGGVPEALGGCGVLVPPRNPEKLAEGITRLLLDPVLRTSLAEDASERANNRFNLKNMLSAYSASYTRLATQQSTS